MKWLIAIDNITQQYIEEWVEDDDFQELNDDNIVDLVTQQPNSYSDEGNGDSCNQQKYPTLMDFRY